MTTEERVLRLENAFATLEELAASAQSNTERLTGLVAQEKARTSDLEKHFKMLSALAVRADERMDGHDAALNNLTAKMEALADAQIRTEETLNRLGAKVDQLAESQVRSDERVSKLAQTIERYISEGRNGKS